MKRISIVVVVMLLFAEWGALSPRPTGDVREGLTVSASRAPASGTVLAPDPPETCPMTPAPAPPFTPPPPYPAKPPGAGSFWFGTEKLWTMLPTDGTWRGLPHYRPTDPGYRQKIFWWRKGYNWRADPNPQLTVRGRRLDAPAPPLVASRATNGFRAEDLKSFMLVGVDIPTLGCWEITGEVKGQELTFVVWVSE